MNQSSSTDAPQVAYPRIALFVDGEWIHDRPAFCEVRNPSDDTVLGSVPGAIPADLERALQSAARGFALWRDTPAPERARVLLCAAELLRARRDEIGRTITLEQGKPYADGKTEVERACGFLEWEAAQALRVYGSVLPSEPRMQRLVFKQPIGPVAAFTPWNVPISSPGRKLGAALAAGCSVILKPSEFTPGAACAFVQCLQEAGLPAGVVNLVFGDPVLISTTLIASPVIRMVTLTGSVQVGKQLSKLAGEAMKPVLMELGGHAPVLVCAGVDGAHVAQQAAAAKMRMAGQICASPTRFIVHRSVYDSFVSELSRIARELRVGDGFAAGVQVGPLMNARRVAAIEGLVQDAQARGARVVAGGQRIGQRGCFFAPTVLADVPLDAMAMSEEPFGPLALCVAFDTLDEALALANSLPLGLQAYAFTNSLEDAERIGRELECGALSINHMGAPGADAPFGGVKDSGLGRESGPGSLEAFLVTKTVLQKTTQV
ncbi:NAD-dependent succinate-semialdehyde dehydrogenase [Rhodoferax sediminis]|uniref:4-(hydroxymethyl)benzenesulfonate dehydrogenase n=1 Tax=Rhodoferax sediminis TaxID=2509614 RepID=A0A515DDZ6_9BURK|nr:NAD-dependent succinate-semialdehyde dehydrogenase [Rhodoferax sediminis]QDL38615.1 NAD-dependent succinate-semialdehyde dehydrogenase [Rhodoferax sediminis]